MSKSWLLVFLIIPICGTLKAQTVTHSIYLIGDAGKDTVPGQALTMLEAELDSHQNSTVIFLGDNIYPVGLEIKEGSIKKTLSELKLLSQLERTKNFTGHVFWIPGNHDWTAGRWSGDGHIKKQAEFVESYYVRTNTVKNDSGHVFLPTGGLPGPALETVDEHDYNLIAIDLQWWLQAQFFHRVPTEHGLSKRRMETLFLDRLDSLLSRSESEGKLTLIVAHHPMFSNGHHGSAKQPLRFLVNWVPPFQLFGLIGLNRALMQDIPQPRYKRIRNKILNVLNKYQNLIYASGHEHNLQYFKKGGNHYLISGAGSKRSSLKGDKYGAEFMDDQNYGFMRLDMLENGSIKCHVFGHTRNGIIHSFLLD